MLKKKFKNYKKNLAPLIAKHSGILQSYNSFEICKATRLHVIFKTRAGPQETVLYHIQRREARTDNIDILI